MISWFGNTMAKYGYNKTRTLPEWATNLQSTYGGCWKRVRRIRDRYDYGDDS
jgi:hypothetical protein